MVLNCFWNLYSSLYSLCCGMDNFSLWSTALLLVIAYSKCSDIRKWCKIEPRQKKTKEMKRERGGFLSPLSLLPMLFCLLTFLCIVPTIWMPLMGFSSASGLLLWPLERMTPSMSQGNGRVSLSLQENQHGLREALGSFAG